MCWGSNELGQTDLPSHLSSEQLMLTDHVADLQAGDLHSCALAFDHTVMFCWGSDLYGQTCIPSTFNNGFIGVITNCTVSKMYLGANST